MGGLEVGFTCYMNGNIINGSNGIQYDTPPCCQFNFVRQIEYNMLMNLLYDTLSIDRNEGLEVIFRYGSIGPSGSTFYVPISLRSEISLRFMIINAPSLPYTIDLFISQPTLQ